MDAFFKDVKHSLHMFLRSPGFTITAIAALALGIGAATAIFSVVNTVLLKPVPVPDPDRLVLLMSTGVSDNGATDIEAVASPAKFEFWRAQSGVIQDVSAFNAAVMNYTGGEVAEQLHSMQASADFLRCWGIPLLRGRSFTQEEDSPSGPRVAVISKELWARRFGSDQEFLGKTISLNGEAYTVVGIAGSAAGVREFGPPPDVYVPFRFDPNTTDHGNFFISAARLKTGVTLEQAKARLRASVGEFRAKFPNVLGPKDGFSVAPFREALVGGIRPLLWVLLGAVGMVLLIACANVANLLLVRATGRRREIAIRTAIGAGRGRMIRQLMTESVLLSLAGGALGLLLGFAGIRSLLAVNTAGLPLVGDNGTAVGIDWRMTGFAIAVSLVTGIVFGLFPAIHGSRVDLNSVLKESSGRSGTGLRQNKARAVLVISEVSLAVVLLVGSALLIRTFVALYKVERGFETKNVVTMQMSLTGPKFVKSMDAENTIRDGVERIRALPGVVAATATCCIPLNGGFELNFDVIGRPLAGLSSDREVGWVPISPGFFDVFKIPLKRGRTFTGKDDKMSQPVVMINERMAKQYWKDGDPLKDRIIIGTGAMKEIKGEPARQIVGIVGDVRDQGLESEPRPTAYVPQAQLPDAFNAWLVRQAPMTWVVRTQMEPHSLVPAIQEQLRQATGLPVAGVQSMDNIVSSSTGRQQFNMLVMAVFGCAALLLAAIGIYGLMAYTVEQRTQEIGIRLALGAKTSQVRNMVVKQGMGLALAGVVIGIGAAWALARVMESLLFGVKGRDPFVFVAVPAMLSVVALVAAWLPATRASRVNPIDCLRYE
jgi:putative ABC transport system permease protein